jgi:hypothetical protein
MLEKTEWSIKRNWQHRVHKIHDEDKQKTQIVKKWKMVMVNNLLKHELLNH